MSKMTLAVLCVVALALGLAAPAQADTITHPNASGVGSTTINMDFVPVGNAGNTADDTTYGAVAYDYLIGTYEVSAAQWAAVILADSSVGNVGYWSGAQPTAGTSWNEAARFCNWLTTGSVLSGYYTIVGGVASIPAGVSHTDYAASHGTTYFIPTEDEWYKAAYYNPGTATYFDYPTGNDTAPTATAGSTTAGEAVYNGQSAPADVNNAGGLSAYDTMAQGGNVWEWNEALIGSCRGRRGGSFSYGDGYLLQSGYRDNGYNPSYESTTFGFRVSMVPEPATIALLGLGGLGVLLRRKRR
jgi:sulfatase modifying factor 1